MARLAHVGGISKCSSRALLQADPTHLVPSAPTAPSWPEASASKVRVALTIAILADVLGVRKHPGWALFDAFASQLHIPARVAI
jgi:hypothetical protein